MITDNPPPETSMDEILASIRKIISADAQSGIHVENPSFFSSDEPEDILELTEALPEESLTPQSPMINSDIHVNDLGEWSPHADKSIYLEENERFEQDVSNRGAPYTTPPYETVETTSAPLSEEPLLSQATMTEAMQAFQAIHTLKKDKPTATEPRLSENAGGQVLENLMKEMLKPLLKEWLDAHLPTLVRSVVTEQVERIVGQGKRS